ASDGIAEIQLLRLVLANRICKAIAELFVDERDSAVQVRWVAHGYTGHTQCRDRQREYPAEGSRTDRNRHRSKLAPRENHCQQPPEGVTDDHRFTFQLSNDRLLVVGDL